MGKAVKSIEFSDASLQILHVLHEVGDHAPSVILTVGDERMCFNCAEGFQRCSHEAQLRITKVSSYLLTRVAFQTCSGLPGTLLTFADAAAASLASVSIVGPPKLGLFMNSVVAYSDQNFDKMKLHVDEVHWPAGGAGGGHHVLAEPVVKTPVVTAHAVLLRAGDSAAQHASGVKRPREDATAAQPGPDAQRTTAAHVVMYVCKLASKRGKFLKEKATALGVKPGQDFGRLTRGESVVSTSSGDTVTPDMCMAAATPGEVVVVAECPSLDYLPALHGAVDSVSQLADDAEGGRVKVVVHLTCEAVARSPEYRAWLARLPTWDHVMAGRGYDAAVDAPSLYSAHQMQSKLHLLQPSLFLAPQACLSLATSSGSRSWHPWDPADSQVQHSCGTVDVRAEAEPLQPGKGVVRHMRNLERLILRPLNARGHSAALVQAPRTDADMRAEMAELAGAVSASKDIAERLASGGAASTTTADGQAAEANRPNVVLLGTGAACPSKYRNVTALYADFGGRGGMLIDCGEGTWGQLVRAFGRAEAERRIRELRCVWISHRHADHHAGLPRLLALRARLLLADSPLLPVFGPWPLRRVLSACNKIEPLRYTWVDQYTLTEREQAEARGLAWFWDQATEALHGRRTLESVCEELGLESMRSVIVHHCKHSFALVLRSKEGWSFAFSGDTQRCEALAAAAQGVTIMVHEATFENGLELDAKAKRHSTVNDALKVGKDAGCQSLILTHFSQRYPKVPDLLGAAEDAAPERIGIAYDLMRLSLSQLDAPAAMVPVLSELFRETPPAGVEA